MFIVYAIMWIIIWGGLAAAIASSKGGEGGIAFLAGAVLGPIGVIISLFMGSEAAKAQKELANGTKKKCPRCAELVQREALVCRFCGHEFEVAVPTYVIANEPEFEVRGDMVPAEDAGPMWQTILILVVIAIVTVSAMLLFVFMVPATPPVVETSSINSSDAANRATAEADNALAALNAAGLR